MSLPRKMSEEIVLRIRACDLEVLRRMQSESGSTTVQALVLDLIESHTASFRLKQIEERTRAALAEQHAAIPPFAERPPKRGQWPFDSQSQRVHEQIRQIEQARRHEFRNTPLTQNKRRRRARLVALIQQGLTSSQCCERMKIGRNTFLRVRKRLTASDGEAQ